MMASSTIVTPAIACAEAISCLHLLHAFPAQPSVNSSPGLQNAQPGKYALPFEKEQELVSTLAFLSSVNDDPSYVPALCVHEDSTTGMLNVLTAVNQARHGDGGSTLQSIKHGFEKLFASLSREEDEGKVFAAIVSMSSVRILSRMRFARHKRNKARQTITKLLQETVRILGGKFPEFRHNAQTAVKSINLWAKHQTEQRLCNVVDAVLQLSRTKSLTTIVGSIANNLMGPSERSNLLKMIRRVGRYREAATFLHRLARKHRIAQRMNIITVTLPKAAFPGSTVGHHPDLTSFLSRLELTEASRNLDRISRILKSNEAEAKTLFAKQCTKTMSEGKIHSEIQLVYYCETTRPFPPPRVIASSKMACFLCNEFICHVTKFYTRRCHGRLYPGWKLPAFPSTSNLARRFAQTLESRVKSSVKTLLLKRARTVYPQPSESTLWTIAASATTINVADEGETPSVNKKISSDSDVGLLGAEATETPSRLTPYASGEPESMREVAMENKMASVDIKEDPSAEEAMPISDGKDIQRDAQKFTLQAGKAVSAAVVAGSSPPFFAAEHLKLQIEYTVGPSHSSQAESNPKLCCRVEWLTPEDAALKKRDGESVIINAEALDGELPIPADDVSNLYVSAYGELLSLRISSIV